MTAPVQEGHPTGVEPIVRDAFYIGGEWVAAPDRETADVIDATTEEVAGRISLGTAAVIEATTEEVAGRISLGTAADVDRAVAAARSGFEEWSQSSIEQRIDAL